MSPALANMPVGWRTFIAFAEAFLTVEGAGLGGIMAHQMSSGAAGVAVTYAWPSLPALVVVSIPALLAGVRRVQALFTPPPAG